MARDNGELKVNLLKKNLFELAPRPASCSVSFDFYREEGWLDSKVPECSVKVTYRWSDLRAGSDSVSGTMKRLARRETDKVADVIKAWRLSLFQPMNVRFKICISHVGRTEGSETVGDWRHI